MKDVFKDYGPAIGPALAFLFGLGTLLLKQKLDQVFARRDADRRIAKILQLLKDSPPPRFEGPISALSHPADVLRNALSMRLFLDRVAVIMAVVDAAESVVHQHGRPATILRYQNIRQHLEIIGSEKGYFRGKEPHLMPVDENFFNIEQAWNAAVATSEVRSTKLTYPSAT